MSDSTKGIIFILVYALLSGISPVVTKGISQNFPATLIVFSRYLIGAILLFGIILSNKKLKKELKQLTIKQWVSLSLLGVISSSLASLLFVVAIRKIGAGLATLLTTLELPIGIYLGMLICKEKITWKYLKIAGVVLTGFGLLVMKPGIKIEFANNFFQGVLIALGAAFLWGISTVLGKLLLNKNISPIIITSIRGFSGAGGSWLLGILMLPSTIIPFINLSINDWGKLAYLGIGVSALGLLFYYQALARLEIKKISLFYTFQPVVTVIIGAVIGEAMFISQWIGAVLVILGIIKLLIIKEKI